MGIEVILADDHAIVREGIRAVVETMAKDINIAGEAATGDEVLRMARHNPADVYILDISMPILNGIETSRRLIKSYPKSKIIILSIHNEKIFVERALKYGAKGYLLKDCAAEEVVRCIREVYMNRVYLCSRMASFIVQGFLGKRGKCEYGQNTTELTDREREVLQLIAEGFSNKEIATRLGLSLNTAHVHRNNIIRKLDIHRQAELIRYALREGISQL